MCKWSEEAGEGACEKLSEMTKKQSLKVKDELKKEPSNLKSD